MKLWSRWEVFNPINGIPIYSVPFRWLAALIVYIENRNCHISISLDYAKKGKGW